MKIEYKTCNDDEKLFYFHLGLLSTMFAEMEANVVSLLGGHITDDLFLINPIIEKNSLSFNIDLLKKVNLYKDFEKTEVERLIEKISCIRKNRNLFIHGIWGKPYKKDNDVIIDCYEFKITEVKVQYGKVLRSAKQHSFKLSEITSQIDQIDEIIKRQKSLLEKLERI
ncbi:MAG: hypothetical protein IM638_17395 [Bacteroidetes bacterium]|nr:hypothetical protein [Bacteroidota bacterium]